MKRTGEARAAMLALTKRELLRFVRQPSRIVAAVGTGALIWLLLAGGLSGSFVSPGAPTSDAAEHAYSAYLIPGMATMVVLFSSVFAAISLIQDRHAGFLQAVLVSPTPGWAIVGSKAGSAAILAVFQAAFVIAASPLVGVHPGVVGYILAGVALVLASVLIVCVGLTLAWKMDSVAGFHGVMNLVLLPMWVFSGAVFPLEGMANWMRWLARVNPLAWSTGALADALGTGEAGVLEWGGAVAAAAGAFTLAMLVIGKRRVRGGGEEGA